MDARRHRAGDMGHVDQKESPYLVGYFAEPFEIYDSRIGACPGDDQLRPLLPGYGPYLVIVDLFCPARHVVGHGLKKTAREAGGGPVGEMPAVGEVHPQDLVARLENGEEDGHVGR